MDIDAALLELKTPKKLDVLTTGAHLLIDISKNIKASNLLEARNEATSKYPKGCIVAKMITQDKKYYLFSNQGILWSQGNVQVSLSSTGELNTDLEFTMVIISSCAPIQSAEVTWVNYKK